MHFPLKKRGQMVGRSFKTIFDAVQKEKENKVYRNNMPKSEDGISKVGLAKIIKQKKKKK